MKKCLIEMIGSYFFVLAIVLTGNPIAIGLMLATLIVIGAHVSGGHFTPIVSLVHFMHKKISFETLLKYSAFQTIGALIGLALFKAITNVNFIPEITSGLSLYLLFWIEAILSLLFCLLIITVSEKKSSSQGIDYHSAIIVGLSFMSIAFIGGLFNPSIAVSSLIYQMIEGNFSMNITQIIVQIFAPCAGSIGATYLYRFINN